MAEYRKLTQDELLAEARERFGDDTARWAAYGLFRGPWEIVLPDGRSLWGFPLALASPAEEGAAAPEPAVGQVWQDADRRVPGRYLLIQEITDTHAVMIPVAYDPATGGVTPQPVARGRRRQTRVQLRRLRPTSSGYRYITTVAGGVL
ncbi:hypothetical protein [Streptomyces sp. NBRC 109706]|uniref:hypothetical protein n=1 Tax=Streptomyces sp. NBRC 109706 TaxID=1550035 RepID=UPI000A5DE3FC|nr:hypothetical protein [Streptomyces sp. NBRC 109706]